MYLAPQGRVSFTVNNGVGCLTVVLTMSICLLARALQALHDPYCQSTCLCVSVCVSVCLSADLMLNISETKRFRP